MYLKKVVRTDKMCDDVCSEWLLYACETALDDVDPTKQVDICEYWQHVSVITETTGEKKYTNLSYVAKAALSLSHGNASPERGFSVNNSLLTNQRGSLPERSIIALRVLIRRL